MDDKFIFGICLGMVGGALLVANSNKARQIVKDSQEKVEDAVKQMNKPKKS